MTGPPSTLEELASLNDGYAKKFGFVYLVCASGRGAQELLEDLRRRLSATRADELRTAAEEQAKITRLRIERWLEGTP
jgi:2-oxo-4-hydroxy-4-carboxy--5-ureidoimidazoline (OHCU) decarboxylase